MTKNNLYSSMDFVVGAGGVLGRAFVNKLSADSSHYVVACSRNDIPAVSSNVFLYRSDSNHFLGKFGTKTSNTSITFPTLNDIVDKGAPATVRVYYAAGPFEFDGETPNPLAMSLSKINPKIYEPNVVGLHHYFRAVCEFASGLENPRIQLVCFDSISTREHPPFWQSYSLSKQIMKRYLKSTVGRKDSLHSLSALVVNTSTINTGAENSIRPGATPEQKAGWLEPAEVVDKTLCELSTVKNGNIEEIDICRPTGTKPRYNSKDCFDRWQQQMKPA